MKVNHIFNTTGKTGGVAFWLGHVYVVLDQGYLSFEGHYWPFNNYWVTPDGDCVHGWRKPHVNAYHVTRDHSLEISWGRRRGPVGAWGLHLIRWPFIRVHAY